MVTESMTVTHGYCLSSREMSLSYTPVVYICIETQLSLWLSKQVNDWVSELVIDW